MSKAFLITLLILLIAIAIFFKEKKALCWDCGPGVCYSSDTCNTDCFCAIPNGEIAGKCFQK